jgi:hypothetical protein
MSYFNVPVLFEQKDGFCTTFAFGVFVLVAHSVYGGCGNNFHKGPLAERTKIRTVHIYAVM